MLSIESIDKMLRQVPDFPKPGVNFLEMGPILNDPNAFKALVDHMIESVKELKIDKIIGIESRGFILGAVMADRMGAGFIMVRKKGKLPGPNVSVTYSLEYGEDTLELSKNSLKKGERVLIVDDVLATGGTAKATADLCQQVEAEVVGLSCFIEIPFLKGRDKFPFKTYSLLEKD